MKLLVGVTVLTLGLLSVGPRVRATESEDVITNGNVAGEPFEGARLSLPFHTYKNFSLGAVSESSAEDTEADKLAKQLANPISSLISVPFQANEDWGTVQPATATSSLLTFSRSFRFQLAKIGT